MNWTPEELAIEWLYRYRERLGILCGSAEPTGVEMAMARSDADAVDEALKQEP